MRKITQITILLALLVFTSSCRWKSVNDTVSVQKTVNGKLVNRTTEQVLNILGQPSSTETDSLSVEGLTITKFHYDDKEVLQWFTNYDEKLQSENPFIDVYLKNDRSFSVKTNIVQSAIPEREATISIVQLSVYSGAMLLIVFICCISLLVTRKKTIKDTDAELLSLQTSVFKNRKDIDNLLYNNLKTEKQIQNLNDWTNSLMTSSQTIKQMLKSLIGEDSLMERDLTNFGLSKRTYNALILSDIKTLGQLCSHRRNEIKELENLGKKSLYEIDNLLKTLGLSYASKDPKKQQEEKEPEKPETAS